MEALKSAAAVYVSLVGIKWNRFSISTVMTSLCTFYFKRTTICDHMPSIFEVVVDISLHRNGFSKVHLK